METMRIGNVDARPRIKAIGSLKVAELSDCSAVEIPVGVINEQREGPCPWSHRSHGNEWDVIDVTVRLFREVKPEDMAGAGAATSTAAW